VEQSAFSLAAVALLLLLAGLLAWRPVYSWTAVVGTLLVVIVLIPIKRFEFGVNLPFQLEPYRLALAGIVAIWLLSLLTDPQVRLRAGPLHMAVAAVAVTTVLSVVANLERVKAVETVALKANIFFASYIVLFVLLASVITDRASVRKLVKVLVIGGTAVAVLAVLEPRLGYNPYDAVLSRAPLLVQSGTVLVEEGRGPRAAGPAQHPIALGAALVMLVPLALYLAWTTGRKRWWFAAFVMTAAGFATLSRTTIVMLATVAAVFLWLRRRETMRAAPLALVLLVGIHFMVPGALGAMKAIFFPPSGLVAEHSNAWAVISRDDPTWCSYTGRLTDLGPSLRQAADRPFLGYGFGTRVTVDDPATGVPANACVLDNQWLGTLLDLGLAGLLAWIWLFVRFIRGGSARSRTADDDTAWLLTALVAALTAFGVGMFLFDAFSFIQVMLLAFVLLALGSVVLRVSEGEDSSPQSPP
jgi:O-antigen ligase